MISDVLNKFKETIANNVLRADGKDMNVAYVDLRANEETLKPDTINLVLFTSTDMKEIMGNNSYGTRTTGGMALQEKPALKLNLNVLLIFNLNDYINAIDCYSQVLGYFYNKDILDVMFDGYVNPINVLLSGFDDRNEIDIRESFNIPGTPLLRYDLRYALIQGGSKQLPLVKETSLRSAVPNADTAVMSAATINFVLGPAQDAILGIQQGLTVFGTIELQGASEERHGMLLLGFDEMMDAYEIGISALVSIRAMKEAQTFNFALNDLIGDKPIDDLPIISLIANQVAMQAAWDELNPEPTDPTSKIDADYAALKTLASEEIEINDALEKVFVDNVTTASIYQHISINIMEEVEIFNVLGDSTYMPNNSIDPGIGVRPDLTTLQVKKKWWEIEDQGKILEESYDKQQEEYLKEQEEPYETYRQALQGFQRELTQPLGAMSALNEKYNQNPSNTSDIDSTIEKEYAANYSDTSTAVNYTDNSGETIEEGLAAALQDFLKSITK